MQHVYTIDNKSFSVDLHDEDYSVGKDEILSHRFGDLTATKSWFNEGFVVEKASGFYDPSELYKSTDKALRKIIHSIDSTIDLKNFSLEKYHMYVPVELHLEVIKRTRRLFPEDLSIDTRAIVEKFGDYFKKKISFENPITKKSHWMIARINRPESKNYNSAHKDIYEIYDSTGEIPKMINVWIPLSGVSRSNSLPVVPGSHRLSENKILRTKAGSTINGTRYSVASIKSWDDDTNLQRVSLKGNELLIFSSHLIHGLAYNNNSDTTRLSFEFRLYAES